MTANPGPDGALVPSEPPPHRGSVANESTGFAPRSSAPTMGSSRRPALSSASPRPRPSGCRCSPPASRGLRPAHCQWRSAICLRQYATRYRTGLARYGSRELKLQPDAELGELTALQRHEASPRRPRARPPWNSLRAIRSPPHGTRTPYRSRRADQSVAGHGLVGGVVHVRRTTAARRDSSSAHVNAPSRSPSSQCCSAWRSPAEWPPGSVARNLYARSCA